MTSRISAIRIAGDGAPPHLTPPPRHTPLPTSRSHLVASPRARARSNELNYGKVKEDKHSVHPPLAGGGGPAFSEMSILGGLGQLSGLRGGLAC